MKAKIFLAGSVLFMVLGCVPSLHKLYTADVEVFEDGLLGAWTAGEDKWEFEKVEKGKKEDVRLFYILRITDDKGRAAKFDAHLVKLGEKLFLDVYPEDGPEGTNDWYNLHILPVHTFMSVELKDGKLSLAVMNPEALEKLIEKKPGVIKHEVIDDDRIVLTASTAKLQKFLIEYADHDEFYGEAEEFERYVPKEPVEVKDEAKLDKPKA